MIMSSCTNDDITISKTVNFTVDPSSIHGAFTLAEATKGDLESFSTSRQLNVLLYIYDENGDKVAESREIFSNYIVQMKYSSYLAQGNYTAVAITHVTGKTDGFKYWEISGSETLEGLRIKDEGYIGGQNKILGIAVEHFMVKDNTIDLNIKVKPAGAMVTIIYYDTDYLKNNGFYNLRLKVNKTMDYLEFDRSGNSNVIVKNDNNAYNWIFDSLDDEDLGSIYWIPQYEFILPMNNVGFGFRADYNGETYTFGEDGIMDIKQGASYFILIDTNDDDFYWGELTEPLWAQVSFANKDVNVIAEHASSKKD